MSYNESMYLCVDIGGTKTLLALVDKSGKLLHSIKFPTIDNQVKYYSVLKQQIKVNFVMSCIDVISVAMPGIIRDNKAIWLGNLNWHDFDIAKLLNADFDKPVYVENDANLAALAEARGCTGRSVYYTFSTGIGGGVVEDGHLVKRFLEFEPGHNEYVYLGKKAEWEDIAAASAVRKHFGKLIEEITEPADWQDIVDRMILGLVPLTTSIKPDRLIFGGPLGLALNSYRDRLRKTLDRELPAKIKRPRLLVAKYGSFSVIYGCYYYAKSQQARR